MKNHYHILGIQRDAQQQQIRDAYHKLALEWHPDKNINNRTKAVVQFQKINEAYNTLSNQESKKIYDKNLETRDIIRNLNKRQEEQEKAFQNQLSQQFNLIDTYLTQDEQDTINKFLNRIDKSSKRIKKKL